jgi:hypothetical protein
MKCKILKYKISKFKKRIFKIQHCSTDKMIADALTKPLHGQQFRNLKDKILGEEWVVTEIHKNTKTPKF